MLMFSEPVSEIAATWTAAAAIEASASPLTSNHDGSPSITLPNPDGGSGSLMPSDRIIST
jgi:hypothetical protein